MKNYIILYYPFLQEAILDMEEKYLSNKNKIYYRKNNFNPKKETIIFVHGVSGSSSAWIPYEKKFEKEFNILTFDLRGHGKSFRPKKSSDYSLKKSSEDLYSLVKHERISNFFLIGHSFGNLIILEFLKKHQKMVKAVIFVSVEYAPSKRKSTKSIKPLFVLSPLLRFLYKKNKNGQVNYSKYKNTSDWNLRRMYADIKNTGLTSFLYSIKNSLNFNAENFLIKIKIPVLIVHGQKDTIFPISSAKEMSKKIKGAEFIVIKEANHIIVLNFLNKLSKIIEKFLAKYHKTLRVFTSA